MKLAINALRAYSGGAKTHLKGILSGYDPRKYGITEIHVWTYPELILQLTRKNYIHYHTQNIYSQIYQLLWEFFCLQWKIKKWKCNVVLNIDAATFNKFAPSITMSRDMLSYEMGEMFRYGFSIATLRLIIIKIVQNISLRTSTGAIFLTKYAGKIIQKSCGRIDLVSYIPHGVGNNFRTDLKLKKTLLGEQPIQCLYVSNLAPYKHHWHVVRAVKILRDIGFNIKLTMTGGGDADGKDECELRLNNEIKIADPKSEFVEIIGFVNHSSLPKIYSEADIFVYASSCENMPNTLVEAMAVGLPICCSNRGPMPEVLGDGGVYFNPEDSISIASAIKQVIKNEKLRHNISKQAKEISTNYSWERCSKQTWAFVEKIYNLKNQI